MSESMVERVLKTDAVWEALWAFQQSDGRDVDVVRAVIEAYEAAQIDLANCIVIDVPNGPVDFSVRLDEARSK